MMRTVEDILDTVLDLWREVLAPFPVDLDSNLISAGGSSLTAAVIATKAREATGRTVGVRTVMENPTPRAFAAAVVAAEPRVTAILSPSIRSAIGPTSVQQEAIWFLEQILPTQTAYNSAVVVRIRGSLDVDRLRAVCADTIAQHELLHSRFETIDGTLTRITVAPSSPIFEVIPMLGPYEPLAESLGKQPFDIGTAPLIRWHLLALAQDDHALVQVEHHLVHDGWSTWIVLTDIADRYRQEPTFDEQATDDGEYDAFCRRQRAWLNGSGSDAHRAFWRRTLSGRAAPVRFAGDAQRPVRFTGAGSTVEALISDDRRAVAARLAADCQVTPFVVLWTAFAVLIGHWTGSEQFNLGSMLRNRVRAGADRTVGMFVNTIAVPISGWSNRTFADFTSVNREMFLSAEEYGELPFPNVAADVGGPRDLSRNPVFQVSFSMNDWPGQKLDFGQGSEASLIYPSNGGAKFDLDVVVLPEGDTVRLLWRYYTDLLSADEVNALISAYDDLLEAVAARPHTLLGTLAAMNGPSS